MLPDRRFGQPDVELVQALALQIPHPGTDAAAPDPDTIQALIELLPRLNDEFTLQRLAGDERRFPTPQSRHVALLQEHLRAYTQRVRNWGYLDSVVRIVRHLCSPLDGLFVECLGIRATAIVSLFQVLVRRVEELVSLRFRTLRHVLSATTIPELARRYHDAAPDSMTSPNEFIDYARRLSLGVDDCRALIVAYSEHSLPDVFSFTPESIAGGADASPDAVRMLLQRLAIRFGELQHADPAFLFLDNPVWKRPLVAVDDGAFFCPFPLALFSFIFPVLDTLLDGHSGLRQAYERRRAQFLEDEVARLFTMAFPGAEILRGFKWREGPDEYQNDLLVRVDSHLFVIEAKSGGISPSALRGSPDRARRHIKELVLEPSQQSSRLAERLRHSIKTPGALAVDLPGLTVRLDLVRTVLRLSVTLEDLAVVQTNVSLLKRTGWIPDDHALAPCLLLADLEVVFDILHTPGLRVHYLRRRAELADHMNYLGDELDLLGLYLGIGFNIGDTEFGDDRLILTGMSKEIDDFCSARADGRGGRKPRARLTRWWADICMLLERRAFHQWTDVENILLSFSFDEQRKTEKMFTRVKHNVLRHWTESNHVCSVVVVPHLRRSDALALYAFREQHAGVRREKMANIAKQVFSNDHVDRCLLVGVNIDRHTYPYGSIAIFYRGEPYDHGNGDDLVVY